MTNISYKAGAVSYIKISGHAMAHTKSGADLCCAAESVLAYALADTVARLLPGAEIIINEAFVYIRFCSLSPKGIAANIALYTVINGFKLLEGKFPQNVYVKKQKEVEHCEQVYCRA